jgi:hypothetical protein
VASLVCRVIEDLDVETIVWVVEVAHRADQALDDVELVVNGKLYRNPRPDLGIRGLLGPTVPCAIVERKKEQPMASEESQDAENGVVREKNRVS